MSWWEAQYATSGRSRCRACKENISQGEARLGISTDQHDHGGGPGCGGWFHVENGCFNVARRWRDVPALSWASVKFKRDLAAEDLATLKKFMKNPSAASSRKKATLLHQMDIYIFKNSDGKIVVSGKTFDIKDDLKKIGARWHFENKYWFFHETEEEAVSEFFSLSSIGKQRQRPGVPKAQPKSAATKTKKRARLPSEDGSEDDSASSSVSVEEKSKGPATKKRRVAATRSDMRSKPAVQLDNDIDTLKLTVPKIKAELSKRGIITKGLKPKLKAILDEDIAYRKAKHVGSSPFEGEIVYCPTKIFAHFFQQNGARVSTVSPLGCTVCVREGELSHLQAKITKAITFRFDALEDEANFEICLREGIPIVDWSYNFPPTLSGFVLRISEAKEKMKEAQLERTSQPLSIKELKERSIAVWGTTHFTWPPFKDKLVVVEREKCLGGCGFFGDPATGYCSSCSRSHKPVKEEKEEAGPLQSISNAMNFLATGNWGE